MRSSRVIYVFGNDDVQQDSLPGKLIPHLKQQFPDINFIHADPTENWHQGEKNIVIIDTVEGIKDVTLFDSLDSFQQQTNQTSLHDYDVYTDIALMKKIGKITLAKIIGVPIGKQSNKVLNDVSPLIKRVLAA